MKITLLIKTLCFMPWISTFQELKSSLCLFNRMPYASRKKNALFTYYCHSSIDVFNSIFLIRSFSQFFLFFLFLQYSIANLLPFNQYQENTIALHLTLWSPCKRSKLKCFHCTFSNLHINVFYINMRFKILPGIWKETS